MTPENKLSEEDKEKIEKNLDTLAQRLGIKYCNPSVFVHYNDDGSCKLVVSDDSDYDKASTLLEGALLTAGLAKHSKTLSEATGIKRVYGETISERAYFASVGDLVLCANALADIVKGEKIDVPEAEKSVTR